MRVPYPVRLVPTIAERVWFTPPRPRSETMSRDEAELFGFQPITVNVNGRPLPGYGYGEGPLIILAHGWGGTAGQMKHLAQRLAAAGFKAVAVDAPGHGQDEQPTSDGFQMAAALEALAQQVGPPAAVIAHSLGAMAAVLASFDRLPQAVVFIAPILDLREALSRFCARARLAPWTVQSLRRRVRRFVGERWHEVTIGAQADIPGASILIMHDPEDPDAPFATAVALAERRPDTHLVELAGLGHRRALKDPAAIDTVVAFVSSVLTGTPGVRPQVPR